MKNVLTIYYPNGLVHVYRNVEHFETLANGVNTFDVGPDTEEMVGVFHDTPSTPKLGMHVKFVSNFIYKDYSDTKAGEIPDKPASGDIQ